MDGSNSIKEILEWRSKRGHRGPTFKNTGWGREVELNKVTGEGPSSFASCGGDYLQSTAYEEGDYNIKKYG
jgi:hypothetical protein